MSDTSLVLGTFVFEDFEIPASIPFGGEQLLAKHQLVGGDKVVQPLGPTEETISWSGRFRGEDAEARALELDALRKAGKPLALTWSQFAYTVVIQRFRGNFERFYEVPYEISLEVVSNDHAPAEAGAGPDIDDMVSTDMGTANTLAARIGDPKLTSLVGSLQGAVTAAGSFASATQATIASVLAPIVAVQNQVSSLIGSAESVLNSAGSLGGVLPGLHPSILVSGLLGQVRAANQVSDLYDMGGAVGRMAKNLITIGFAGAQRVTAGGDLFTLAAQTYGDAAEWTTIAKANGLADPTLRGVKTLLIPPSASGSGGVLGL